MDLARLYQWKGVERIGNYHCRYTTLDTLIEKYDKIKLILKKHLSNGSRPLLVTIGDTPIDIPITLDQLSALENGLIRHAMDSPDVDETDSDVNDIESDDENNTSVISTQGNSGDTTGTNGSIDTNNDGITATTGDATGSIDIDSDGISSTTDTNDDGRTDQQPPNKRRRLNK